MKKITVKETFTSKSKKDMDDKMDKMQSKAPNYEALVKKIGRMNKKDKK